MSKPKSAGSFNELIEGLKIYFEDDNVDVDDVKDFLASYKSTPSEWRQFAKFDTYRYTRNLVDAGNGKYNVMLLCWGEAMGSSIHDHTGAHCFVKMLDGKLRETMYEWPEQKPTEEGSEEGVQMREREHHDLGDNDVAYINDTIGLHRVENPSHSSGAVSLHIYIPPFDKCLTFDQRTGRTRVSPVTFWSKYGQKCVDNADKKSSLCSPYQPDPRDLVEIAGQLNIGPL